MWDPKPDAPVEIRGEFRPIATSVPGVWFGEHLPKFARQMHRCTVIRSAHHSVNNAHAAAVYCALTGHDRGEIGGGAGPFMPSGSSTGEVGDPEVSEGCSEIPDTVEIDGPTMAMFGEMMDLRAVVGGMDPSTTPSYHWEVVSGGGVAAAGFFSTAPWTVTKDGQKPSRQEKSLLQLN